MANQNQLVRRDAALAVLIGAIPGYSFGSAPPRRPAPRNPAQPGYGFGWDYGWGWGFGEGAAAAPAPAVMPPHPAALARVHNAHPGHPMMAPHALHPAHPAHPANIAQHLDPSSTASRTLLLDPNRGSTVKVERYSFSFSPAANLTLGTTSAIASFTQQPSTSIKGQRVIMNAPIEGFVTIDTLQIANVNVFVGGTEDAFNYNARAQNVVLDLPRLDPQNRATASGNYSGALPPGFTAGASFKFIITLQGPSTLAGGLNQ